MVSIIYYSIIALELIMYYYVQIWNLHLPNFHIKK